MGLEKKPLPRPSLRLVLDPTSDTEHRFFENAALLPFHHTPAFSRVNAWWLAEASLLSYWDAGQVQDVFRLGAGLESVPVQERDAQAFVAWNATFALVAFRGSETDSLLDILTSIHVPFSEWDVPGERVHSGFMDALDGVWQQVLSAVRPLLDRPMWFTGHSQGGTLATLAGDRFLRELHRSGSGELGGIYSYGAPSVGNRSFVDGFNARCGIRSFRFVNDLDTLTRLPPPFLGYRHVTNERFLGFNDPDISFQEPLIDHTAQRYAVLTWNALIDELDGSV